MSTNKSKTSHSTPFLSVFMSSIISRLQQNNQHRTWQHYRSTLNSFMRFRAGVDVRLADVDTALMESYESYLRHVGVCRNTSSFYMRILRAVYNRAVEQSLIVQLHPFRHVYTGIEKTRKRAISLDAVRQVGRLDLAHSRACDMARDAFLMSFYLRGISFVDLAHLRKTDLRDGILRYSRSKTRQHITVKWEARMQAIVDKYCHLTASTPYLFPFLQIDTVNAGPRPATIQHYHNAESRIAYHLKKIGRRVGLKDNLTLYVARHSWATAARDLHCPISVISEALGHNSEHTTQIYLRSIQTSEVDNINARILSQLT